MGESFQRELQYFPFNSLSIEFPQFCEFAEFGDVKRRKMLEGFFSEWNASQIRFYRGCWATGMLSVLLVLSASVKRLWGPAQSLRGFNLWDALLCTWGCLQGFRLIVETVFYRFGFLFGEFFFSPHFLAEFFNEIGSNISFFKG